LCWKNNPKTHDASSTSDGVGGLAKWSYEQELQKSFVMGKKLSADGEGALSAYVNRTWY